MIAFLAWLFFSYVDYILNIITSDSFVFDLRTLAVIDFVVLTSIVSMALAIFREKRWTLMMAGAVGLVFIALFGADYINWIGIGIAALLFLRARQKGIEEIDQRTKINFRMVIRRSVSSVITAFFVLTSFAAYQSPVAKGIAEAEQLPSVGEQLTRSVVENVIGGQIKFGGPEKENVINQTSNEIIQQFNIILKPYFQYAPPLLAFGLFLILWSLSWFFVWLSVFVGMGIFWALKKFDFIRIEEKDVKAEFLAI